MHPRIPHPIIPHLEIDDPAHIKGVRTVATVEFTKGIVVVLAGLGVFSMRRMDIWGIAESFLEFFHVNPLNHYVGVFVDLVYRISDVRKSLIGAMERCFRIIRFVEAYALAD